MIGRDGQGLAFLLSTPRSGSTLLGAILGSHSEIACPPEPWFMLPLLGVRDQHRAVIAPYDHDLAQRATHEFVDEHLFLEAAKAFATTVYQARLEQAGKHIFVDKDTRYFHITRQLAQMYPRALYVWLQRNPLDVMASYKNTWQVQVSDIFGSIFAPNSFDLAASFDLLHEHVSNVSRSCVIRYEDLVERPAQIVEQLCRALAISFQPGMLSYFENDSLMGSYSRSLFGDKKLHRESSVHANSVGTWRDVLTPEDVRLALLVLGSAPFTAMGYHQVLADALDYAALEQRDLSPEGRRAAYLEALRTYPACNAEVLLHQPSLWPEGVNHTAPVGLGQAFQSVLREKEAIIERVALEAAHRLSLLETSQASLMDARQALVERDAVVREVVREGKARLERLLAADAARAQLQSDLEASHRSLEEKDAAIHAVVREADARLALLVACDTARANLERQLLERQSAIQEKEEALLTAMREADASRHQSMAANAESVQRQRELEQTNRALEELRLALDQKEAALQAITREADTRLQHLSAADAARTQLERDLAESHRALEEKEAVLQAATVEAETRLRHLLAADAARRTLEEALAQRPGSQGGSQRVGPPDASHETL